MRTLSRVAVLSAGLACVMASSARGYPIPPVPLWSLVEQADVIVLAEVQGVSQRKVEEDEDGFGSTTVATLRILDTWKGRAFGEMEVGFPAGMLCPAPPRYVEGEDVVAFLSHEKSGWQTVGLSYGTLYAESREELEDLREMVRRAIVLQAKKPVSKADRLDWLVEAASRPGTRWHGLYELAPRGDEVHSYYDPARPREDRRLSASQRERIARGFVARPPVDHTLPVALMILAGHPDPKVSETAAAAIEGLLGQERLPYWIGQALQLVLERFGDKQAAQRIKTVREGCCDLDEDGIRILWRSAQRELGIPKVVPLKVARREIRGVGPETPD